MKGTESTKGGNGKCRLFVQAHTAQLTSNAKLSHGLPQRRETKVIYVGKERKHIGLRNTARQVCCRFDLMAEGREV